MKIRPRALFFVGLLLAGCASQPNWDFTPAGRAASDTREARELYDSQVRRRLTGRVFTSPEGMGEKTKTAAAFLVPIVGRGINEGRYWIEPGTNAWDALTLGGGVSSLADAVIVLRGLTTATPTLIKCELMSATEDYRQKLQQLILQPGDTIFVQFPAVQ